MFETLKKSPLIVAIGAIALLVFLFSIGKIIEEVDAGEIVVIQYPNGTLNVVSEAGWAMQLFGKATHYKKSNQFWYLSKADKSSSDSNQDTDESLPVTWNDGGVSTVSGSVRYDMPLNDTEMIKVHSIFGSQENIERQLIKTNMEKSIFLTGPLMSSKESYAEKRSDLISLIEDQANKGVYRTKVTEKDTQDPLTGEIKKEKVVEILDKNGINLRQEKSTISVYGLRLYNVAIKNIGYDKTVIAQIKTQQQSIMSVQTAMANAKKAEQDVITAQKQGEANAAEAKWKIEVDKAKMVTKAQADRAVAEENVKTAELNKRRDILEGEGIAAKKRLVMQADGALNEKLNAYIKVQSYWAEAFAKYGGNIVPLYQTGNGGGGNGAFNFMEIMGAKAARDLSLDLSNKNK